MLHKNISYQNTLISYSVSGKGKAVMLVHGFAEDSSVFDTQVNFLKGNYLVLVPDLPGIGKSAMLQKENVQLTDYAAIIKAIIDEEKIEKIALFGHSMGGYITLAFADLYSQTLSGFGLLHSSAYADDDEKINTRKKAITFIKENGTNAFLKTAIPNLFYDAHKSQENINNLIEKGNNFPPDVLIQQYNAMIARPDTTSILKAFTAPILSLMGEHDKAIPIKHSLQQSHLPQIAYVKILRNAGHMGMLEQSTEVNNILADFLHSL